MNMATAGCCLTLGGQLLAVVRLLFLALTDCDASLSPCLLFNRVSELQWPQTEAKQCLVPLCCGKWFAGYRNFFFFPFCLIFVVLLQNLLPF